MGTLTELECKVIGKLTRLRHLAIVKLAILLRLDIDELLGLKHEDISWVNGKSKTLLICRRVQYLGIDNKFNFHVVEDMESSRSITLPKKATDILKWLESNDKSNRAKYLRTYSCDFDGFVCVNKLGRLYQPSVLKRYFKTLFLRTIKSQAKG